VNLSHRGGQRFNPQLHQAPAVHTHCLIFCPSTWEPLWEPGWRFPVWLRRTPRHDRHDVHSRRAIINLTQQIGELIMTYSLSLILLSGPIASGKTTLARDLVHHVSAEWISTSSLISATAGRELDRGELQSLGLGVDFQRARWIADEVMRVAARSPVGSVVVVDSVRTLEQVRGLRNAAPGAWRILHVHLHGENSQLAVRHAASQRSKDGTWEQITLSPTESATSALQAEADVVIDTTSVTPADVAARVTARVSRIRPRRGEYVDVLVGGQWGSEGKGNLAFFMAPEYDLLVRVGAPNAGHKVCAKDGVIYTHRQLPSGTRAADSRLLLGAGAVIDIAVLMREITECAVPESRLSIDPCALVIEADDVAVEVAVKSAIGSTGTGGGAALARRIVQRGVPGAVRTARDIPELLPYIRESARVFEETRAQGGRIFIEGTQGTGLSVLHGSFPHVTSRDTTVGTLLAEVGLPPQLLRRVVVAFRSYPIRVGGPSGPMGREISWETVAQRSGLPANLLKDAELGSVSGNQRRVAEFSWAQLQRSARLNGATDIALTFADYLDARNRDARRLGQLTDGTIEFINEMEEVAAAPISLISAGFDGRGPIDRRLW
jgi:adenylosuccinate synthase